MKKSGTERTTAKNLEEKFNRGAEVLDYFDARKARVIKPLPAPSEKKANFGYPAKRNTSRRVAVRDKSGA